MSLDGAKFICLDEAGNHGEVVLAKGRKFTMGCYASCDYILFDERAKGVHCEIECDAFGRVNIRNLSPDKPILVNGSSVEIKRILLNNSKLSILDKEYLWIFNKKSSSEYEDLVLEEASTPQKLIGIPEQAPNSCPDFKLHCDLPKRFTVHNFAYCIQSDEEADSIDEKDNENAESSTDQIAKELEIETAQSKEENFKDDVSQTTDLEKEKENPNRSITPEPNKEIVEPTTELLDTPKTNVVNYTTDKENNSAEKKVKQMLTLCHQSDVVITSFSPRETGVKICKSFATVIKPKIVVTKPPITPKSVYSTPSSDMNINDSDLIAFHTPSTSKKTKADDANMLSTTKIVSNTSMHLIDLTTPFKQRANSPYTKSVNKSSAKQIIPLNIDKSCTKLASQEQLGVTALPATPVVTNASDNLLETPSSVISVNSSTDNSSVIEVTSDGSNMGSTPITATGLNTPPKLQTRTGVSTPKKTPHSLMKIAILTSAKKQNSTPQANIQILATPRREAINRIPLRSNLAVQKTPTVQQALTANSSISKFTKRKSIGTPLNKYTLTSGSALASTSTSAKSFSRRSTLNPLSAVKALTTSTPFSGNSALRRRAACKTSPLHKVRKSVGGVPLSSHISKSRNSTLLTASVSKITSIKDKSPQQVMCSRLVNRARKSIFVTPISARSRHMVESAKTTSISTSLSTNLNDEQSLQSPKPPERKVVLFGVENTENDVETNILSRTFILDSTEDENDDVKTAATFSPEKVDIIKESDDKTQTIEIPVDAEEIVDLCNENKENTNQTNNEENNILVDPCHEVKHSIAADEENKYIDHTDNIATADTVKSLINEESFAEEINASIKHKNITSSSTLSGSQIKYTETAEQTVSAETTDRVVTEELNHPNSIQSNNETGFGEESSIDYSDTSTSRITFIKENEIERDTETQNIQPADVLVDKTEQIFEEISETKADDEANILVKKAVENKIETKDNANTTNEYKPIVEDITLESSLIENETNDNTEINISKKPLCVDINLEVSLIEEKVKSEAIKEENINTAIEETAGKKQVGAISEDHEMFAQIENKQLTNINVANINLITEKISTRLQEKEEICVNESKNEEKYVKKNPTDIKCLDTNIEVNSETTIIPQQKKDTVSEVSIVTETAENKSDLENLKISQPEQSEKVEIKVDIAESVDKSESLAKNEIDENLDDTNKLLEEIEDVLNKSDEIKQKQLDEIEKKSDKPLTEEFESEQFSEENSHGEHIAEFSNSENDDKNAHKEPEKQVSNESIAKISDFSAVQETTIFDTKPDIEDKSKEIEDKNQTIESFENKQTDAQSNELSNIEKDANIHNVELAEEIVINEIENNAKQVKLVNKNVENVTSFTPRRSARRASQSTDVNEATELKFTPRRSTRRSSMSAESATPLVTPIKRTTRRASLSAVNDNTPLTPKSITKRRVSTSVEDEACSPSTSKLRQRIKTPRRPLVQDMIIPEENDDVVMESEKTAEHVRNQIEGNKNVLTEQVNKVLSETFKETEVVEELSVEKNIEDNISAEAVPEKELTCKNNLTESPIQVEELVETVPTMDDAKESSEINDKDTSVLISKDENISEKIEQEIEISEEIKNDDKNNTEIMSTSPLEDQSEEMEENLQCSIEQEHLIDCKEQLLQDEKSSSSHTELDQGHTEEISLEQTEPPVNEDNINEENLTVINEVAENSKASCNIVQYVSEHFIPAPEVKTPKTPKRVQILADSTVTPLMTGVRELLKTPKPEAQTPRLAGIRNLVHTPKNTKENEAEEMEKLAALSDLVKTPDISTPKRNRHVTIAAESPKTPVMTGVRELLKTPKAELSTPNLTGINDLIKTPKSRLQNELENSEQLSMVDQVVKYTLCAKDNEEMPSSSMQAAKELLGTPHLKVLSELMDASIANEPPTTIGVKELFDSSVAQDQTDIQVVSKTKLEESTEILEEYIPAAIPDCETSLKGVKELLKTPIVCSTPRYKGLRELMKTPKMSSTPALSGIKELLDDSTTVQKKDEELEKFLRTPTAKNIMIPSMPSSAVIEKSTDSIEISTEYDLNATNECDTANLGELFKTPGVSRFVERITSSYYGDEEAEEVECNERTQDETLQDAINKTAEKAFDKLIGQESQINTPIRKRYIRKSFSLQTPTCSSPFSAADVLSDLPKTDVEEWIEKLEQAETPTKIENDYEEEEDDETSMKGVVNASSVDFVDATIIDDLSLNKDEQSFNESFIPETCAKVFITENSLHNKFTTTLRNIDSKDPLFNTKRKLERNPTVSIGSSIDAEISGINLLDQTIDSVQDELSMLDEPSMFDQPLVVTDNESENDLAEPLLLSDSEDLNRSLDTELNNATIKTENELEITETKNDINVQEESMLETISDERELAVEDPLEAKGDERSSLIIEEQKTIVELDESRNEAKSLNKSNARDEDKETNRINTKDEDVIKDDPFVLSTTHGDFPKETNEEQNSIIEISHNIEEDISETQSSEKMQLLEISSTSQKEYTENDSLDNVKISTTIDIMEAEVDAAETLPDQAMCADLDTSKIEHKEAKHVAIEQTKICSTESENIFVDSSVSDICAETSILNQEQIESRESAQEATMEKTDDECQEIFLDFLHNSNIDETFANEENNTEFNETVPKSPVREKDTQIEASPVLELETTEVENSVTESIEVSSEFNPESELVHVDTDSNATESMTEQKSSNNPKTEIVQVLKPDENFEENEEKLISTTNIASSSEKEDSSEINRESHSKSIHTDPQEVENKTSADLLVPQKPVDEPVKIDTSKTEVTYSILPDQNLTKNTENSQSEVQVISVIEVEKTPEENLESQSYQKENIKHEHVETKESLATSIQLETTNTLIDEAELEILQTDELGDTTSLAGHLTEQEKPKSSSFCADEIIKNTSLNIMPETNEKFVVESETVYDNQTVAESTTELSEKKEDEPQLPAETKDEENTYETKTDDNGINFTLTQGETISATENNSSEEKLITILTKEKTANISEHKPKTPENDDEVNVSKTRKDSEDNIIIKYELNETYKDNIGIHQMENVLSKESIEINTEPAVSSRSMQKEEDNGINFTVKCGESTAVSEKNTSEEKLTASLTKEETLNISEENRKTPEKVVEMEETNSSRNSDENIIIKYELNESCKEQVDIHQKEEVLSKEAVDINSEHAVSSKSLQKSSVVDLKKNNTNTEDNESNIILKSEETITVNENKKSEEKLPTTLTKEKIPNILEETPKTPEKADEGIESKIIKDFEEKIIANDDLNETCKDEKGTHPKEEALPKETIDINIEPAVSSKSMHKRSVVELKKDLSLSPATIRYDFDITINDSSNIKENEEELYELPSSSNQTIAAQEIIPQSTLKVNENSAEERHNLTKDLKEIEEEHTRSVKKGQRKRTITESTEESIQGEEIRKSSRRNYKMIKKHVKENLESVEEEIKDESKDATIEIVKEKEKRTRKRTTSESSQGSVIDLDEGVIGTRRGVRRKMQKIPQEAIIEENKDSKTCEATRQTEESIIESHQAADAEDSHQAAYAEDLHEIKQQQDKEVISTQCKTKSSEEISKQQEVSSICKNVMFESDSQIATENILPAIKEISQNQSVDITTSESTTKSPVSEEDNLNKLKEKKTEDSGTNQSVIQLTDSSQIPPVSIKEQTILENIVERTSVLTQESQPKVLNSTSTEEAAEEVDQVVNTSIRSEPTALESIQEGSNAVSSTAVTAAEVPYKRSRRKPTVSESSQDSQQDGNVRSRNTRRKAQKIRIEESVVEESKDEEEQINAKCHQEDEIQNLTLGTKTKVTESKQDLGQDSKIIPKENESKTDIPCLTVDKNTNIITSEGKEILSEDNLSHCDEKTAEAPPESNEVERPTQKRTRRKPNISKSSPEKGTPRTRKAAPKTQKLTADINLIEEENRINLDIPADLNKNQLPSNDNIEKNEKVDSEVSQLATDVNELGVDQDQPAKIETIENNSESFDKPLKQAEETSEKVGGKNDESHEVSSRRGRKKPALQVAILDEPTTSRKRRGKGLVSVSETLSANKTKSQAKALESVEGQGLETHSATDNNAKESNDESIAINTDSTQTESAKSEKVHQIDVEKLTNEKVLNKEDMNINSSESLTTRTKKNEQIVMKLDKVSPGKQELREELKVRHQIETSPKQTPKRGRPRKLCDTKEVEEAVKPNIILMTRRGARQNIEKSEIVTSSLGHKGRNTNRNRRTPVEHITGDSQDEEISAVNEMSDNRTAVDLDEDKQTLQETEHLNNEDEQKEDKELSKKSVKRSNTSNESDKIGIIDEKPAKKRAKHQMSALETLDEKDMESNTSSVEKADIKNIPSQQKKDEDDAEKLQISTKRKAAAKPPTRPKRKGAGHDEEGQSHSQDVVQVTEIKVTELNLEPAETLNKITSNDGEKQDVTVKKVRSKAIVEESHSKEHETPLPSTRRRGIAKQTEANSDVSSTLVKKGLDTKTHDVKDNKSEKENVTLEEQVKIENQAETEVSGAKEDLKETKSGRRVIGKKKEEKDTEKQFTEETRKENDVPAISKEKHIQDGDQSVSSESKHIQEEVKKGRGRRKKIDHKAQIKQTPTTHSPDTKSKVQNPEKSDTDIDDHASKEVLQPSDNIEQQETTVPSNSTHITAESQGIEETPSKRARNVPQRRAAIAYHNYDETSDTEVKTKTKKKTDSPRKSLDGIKKSQTETLKVAPVMSISPAPSSSASITTARGRTKKPTAKVQQYLEKERAKAETPKKKALLAATNLDIATPRSRKASTAEIAVEGTPQTDKGVVRGKIAVLDSHKEEASILTETVTPTETKEKGTELQASTTIKGSSKVRRGRKAKVIEEESHSTDEPLAKKTPLELESEKLEPQTPTRTAGKRNAAAAAKARIEEDALAAAAIDPPKRGRAKRVTQKASSQLVTSTDTESCSTTVAEEKQNVQAEIETKIKSSFKKREHRLASASTVDGVADLDNEEIEAFGKTPNKRGRKAATTTTTDSPAVPTKRGRKAKIIEDVADSKTTRGRGKGHQNVNSDEVEASSSQQNETDVKATPVDTSEPVKRATRTRRK